MELLLSLLQAAASNIRGNKKVMNKRICFFSYFNFGSGRVGLMIVGGSSSRKNCINIVWI